MKIIFAGTPDFSVPTLQALINSKHEVIAVYSQPERPAGRGRKLTASAVKAKALEHNIPIYQPENLKNHEQQQILAAMNADVMIVVAYGLILPEIVLNTPKYGCLNIHASILPRWRGAAPIQRAIEAGDPESGVSIMQMDIGLDTGDILAILTTEITAKDTAQMLHDRLSNLGSTALLKTLEEIEQSKLVPIKQDEDLVTYAHKLSKTEAQINWQENAETIVKKIQAFNPWPVAFTQFQGQVLRIWQAEIVDLTSNKQLSSARGGVILKIDKQGIEIVTGKGIIRLTSIQPTGKKAMPAYDFAQARDLVGKSFE
jgi:methionyl-tRNA formyltransferase